MPTVVEKYLNHNHPPPDPKKVARQIIAGSAKRKALNAVLEPPATVIQAALHEEGLPGLSVSVGCYKAIIGGAHIY